MKSNYIYSAFIMVFFINLSCSPNSETLEVTSDFIGSWKLEKWTSTLADGSTVFPFGEKAYGKLIYEGSGEMTGLFMADDRALMKSADVREREPEEALAAFNSFFAYSGPFEVNRDSSFVLHNVVACSNPNWIGRTQKRFFQFENGKLILSTPPIAVQGTGSQATEQTLVWRKMY